MDRILKKVFINTCAENRKHKESVLSISKVEKSQYFIDNTVKHLAVSSKTLQGIPKLILVSALFALSSLTWAASGDYSTGTVGSTCTAGCQSSSDSHENGKGKGHESHGNGHGYGHENHGQGGNSGGGHNGGGGHGHVGPPGPQGEVGPQGPAGPQGAKGDTGAKGDKGDKGDQGLQGLKGDKGYKGDTGATGAKGDKGYKGDTGQQGLSAYEIALNNGFDGGDEAAWLDSLIGPAGPGGRAVEDALVESKLYTDGRVDELNRRFDRFKDGVACRSSIQYCNRIITTTYRCGLQHV